MNMKNKIKYEKNKKHFIRNLTSCLLKHKIEIKITFKLNTKEKLLYIHKPKIKYCNMSSKKTKRARNDSPDSDTDTRSEVDTDLSFQDDNDENRSATNQNPTTRNTRSVKKLKNSNLIEIKDKTSTNSRTSTITNGSDYDDTLASNTCTPTIHSQNKKTITGSNINHNFNLSEIKFKNKNEEFIFLVNSNLDSLKNTPNLNELIINKKGSWNKEKKLLYEELKRKSERETLSSTMNVTNVASDTSAEIDKTTKHVSLFEGANIGNYKSDNIREQLNTIANEIYQKKKIRIEYSDIIQKNDTYLLKIITKSAEDKIIMDNHNEQLFTSGIKLMETQDADKKWIMTIHNVALSYDETQPSEQAFLATQGIVNAKRYIQGTKKSYYMRIEVKDKENFYRLYKDGIFLTNKTRNKVTPKWRMPRLCTRCAEYGHSSDRCSSDIVTCVKCSGNHHHSECSSERKSCNHCQSKNLNHNHAIHDDLKCSEYESQFEALNEFYLSVINDINANFGVEEDILIPPNNKLRKLQDNKSMPTNHEVVKSFMSQQKEMEEKLLKDINTIRSEVSGMRNENKLLKQKVKIMEERTTNVEKSVAALEEGLKSVSKTSEMREMFATMESKLGLVIGAMENLQGVNIQPKLQTPTILNSQHVQQSLAQMQQSQLIAQQIIHAQQLNNNKNNNQTLTPVSNQQYMCVQPINNQSQQLNSNQQANIVSNNAQAFSGAAMTH